MSQESDRDLSALYRAGAAEEPPARLDRHIATIARRQLRPSRISSFFDGLPHWRLALGAFAVVTLSVSLVTLIKEEVPSTLDPTAAVPATAEPRSSAQEARPPSEVPRPESTERARAQERAAGLPGRPGEVVGQEGKQNRADRRALPEAGRSDAAPAAKPDTGNISRIPEAQTPPAPAQAPEVAAASPSVSAPAAAASRTEGSRGHSKIEDATAFGRLARNKGETTASVPRELSPPTGASPARGAASPSVTEEGPQTWVRRLSEWLAQGREQEVRRELERFRQRYPDFILPDELRRFSLKEPAAGAPEGVNDRSPGGSPP